MAQRGTWLACQTCGFVYVLETVGELPPCPKCQGTTWRTMEPSLPLALTRNDRRFLKSLRILAEEEDGRADEFR